MSLNMPLRTKLREQNLINKNSYVVEKMIWCIPQLMRVACFPQLTSSRFNMSDDSMEPIHLQDFSNKWSVRISILEYQVDYSITYFLAQFVFINHRLYESKSQTDKFLFHSSRTRLNIQNYLFNSRAHSKKLIWNHWFSNFPCRVAFKNKFLRRFSRSLGRIGYSELKCSKLLSHSEVTLDGPLYS